MKKGGLIQRQKLPSELAQSLKWRDNSCHFDTFVESVYFALLEREPHKLKSLYDIEPDWIFDYQTSPNELFTSNGGTGDLKIEGQKMSLWFSSALIWNKRRSIDSNHFRIKWSRHSTKTKQRGQEKEGREEFWNIFYSWLRRVFRGVLDSILKIIRSPEFSIIS